MTVCTNDLALADLVEDRLPGAIAYAFGDVEALVADVVELEDERIALATVDAWSVGEERQELRSALLNDSSLAAEGLLDVALAVRRVVLAFVCGPAWAAVVVALAAGLPAPGEI
jgi:hypothetical protein